MTTPQTKIKLQLIDNQWYAEFEHRIPDGASLEWIHSLIHQVTTGFPQQAQFFILDEENAFITGLRKATDDEIVEFEHEESKKRIAEEVRRRELTELERLMKKYHPRTKFTVP